MNDLPVSRWDRFWFDPVTPVCVGRVRLMLVCLTIAYFASAWPDVDRWYSEGAVLSPDSAASFLRAAGLESQAKWVVSPLFLVTSGWVYRAYLALGIVVGVVVMTGRGGRACGFLFWALLVGWANRSMMLSSLSETLLSLGLFAAAIAVPCSAKSVLSFGTGARDLTPRHWTNGLATKLLMAQTTVFGFATFATMLAGTVWWNGLGAYALAAPVEDRSIDWSQGLLTNSVVHDVLTTALVLAMPLGLAIVWLRGRSGLGIAVLCGWSLAIALLGSHWLYASTFAAMTFAFRDAGTREWRARAA
tara:strand:+ start:240219 stop:241127 length:909 start_codon:yes stop_codon:yes gene_type:complete